MYVPRFNQMPSGEVRRLAAEVGSLELITVDSDGVPHATRLPFVWDEDDRGGDGVVRAHMAWANPHWRSIAPGGAALAVVTGPEAYVSPGFYAAKREHGRVVPTWNYSAIHLRGTVSVVPDAPWLRAQVEALTDHVEAGEEHPWHVGDAPAAFVEQQLKAIVGIELAVTGVEAKAKRSQNRDDADHTGVVVGLEARGTGRDTAMAARMRLDRLP
ncbi:MAG: FMN-binding negative transcriptional regulator [Nocardioides sp.]|uniref:FMN-binding negative transcriptional regulator n=1 Tax=Nocardioides sp. TaxID=35761 RepID=UPI0039E29322